ncbi:putative transcriptional regulator, MerR family protein [Enhygromyxa salina]|uniref:Putative transcriptional regulator, MerR family protein n=1 Tax=Enhygromyxa salina TaxID=215803 RepID=A0A0C2D1G4_9BACT|nr:MerR family transcriptional regulator [Enhygromyxa salina]KIG15650.1 putative transcriptional regulator, MerR family protein [Enhygromyxa salina]
MARARSQSAASLDRARWPYRMKDLCERTGLDRQTVHFYIAKGLMPEGHKTKANMAYYGEEHLERLRLVLELKNERFLPLDAIRAVLDGEDHEFSPEQRALLVQVKERVADVLAASRGTGSTLAAAPLLRKHGVTRDELRKLEQLGLVAIVKVRGAQHISQDDAWVVELWASLRESGFTTELGFGVEDLGSYVAAIDELFEREVRELTPRLAKLPADQVAQLFRQGLPLVNSFLVRYHQAKARQFFAQF